MKALQEIRYYLSGKNEGKQIVEKYYFDNNQNMDYYWQQVAIRNRSDNWDYVVLFVIDPDNVGRIYNEVGEKI